MFIFFYYYIDIIVKYKSSIVMRKKIEIKLNFFYVDIREVIRINEKNYLIVESIFFYVEDFLFKGYLYFRDKNYFGFGYLIIG